MSITYNKAAVRVTKLEQLPSGEHYVIMEFDTVTTWSGYPDDNGSATPVVQYYAFTDRVEWEA